MARVLYNPDGSVKSVTGTPTSRASKAAAASLAAAAPAPTAAPVTVPPAPGLPASQIPAADLQSFQAANPGLTFGAEDLAHYNAAVPTDPKTFAATANQEALQLYERTKDQDIDIRDSQKIIRDLAAKVTGNASVPPPKPPSMMEMFATERQKLGLEPLETELASIDSEIERINTKAFTDADRTSEAPLGMRAIGNKQGAISREAQRKIALLNVQRSAVARQVANKTATLEMVMNFTGQDYANASQAFSQEFERNMQTLDLFMKVEDREITAQDKLKQNATANLQTIWNSIKDSGATFEGLTDTQRRSINQMELQAGLPTGFFESLPAIVPEGKVLSTTTRDVGGMKYADVVTQDPKTGAISVQSVPLGGVAGSGSSGGAAGGAAGTSGFKNEYGEAITPTNPPKAPTEGETTSYVFFSRMKNAVENLSNVEGAIAGEGLLGQLQLKYAPDLLKSEDQKLYSQAQRQFTEARLRKDSGAAIPDQEFENDRVMYFPQPGDTEKVLAQKKQARQVALDALRSSSGNKYWQVYGESPNVANRMQAAQETEDIASLRSRYNY